MSRGPEVCRDFQRGSCRYARCKFLHQQPERNDGRQFTQSQAPALPEHRCNDPRACKERIREDLTSERPTFWRLTCYAHWKHLPNDISGDTSFEELRALAYENAKQGFGLADVKQREAMMNRAKISEYEALLKNPYKGPKQQQSSGVQTNTVFGKPVPSNSFISSSIFGQRTYPSQGASFFSPAPQTLSPPMQQTTPLQMSGGFGGTGPAVFGPFNPSPNVATPSPSIFTGQNQLGNAAGIPPSFSAPFMNSTGNLSNMPPSLGSGFMDFAASAAATAPAPAVTVTNNACSGDEKWKCDLWELGQIPEEEPPQQVRG